MPNYQQQNYQSKSGSRFQHIVLTAVIAILCLIIVPTCLVQCTLVDSAEVGIKFNKLGLNSQGDLDATTCSGYVFYNPITTDVYTYETRVRQVNYQPFVVQTKDGSKFQMDPNLSYQLNKGLAINVFAKYRKSLDEIEQTYMRTAIYDAYRINANKYTADELIAHRAQFEDNVKDMLDSTLASEGFNIEQFTSQIEPPQSLTDMINAKNAAVQAALKAENEVATADANAKIAVAKAKGEAEAKRIQADGEAYYNRTVAASLNELLVRQDAIKKWNGELPTYTGGGTPLIQLK